MAVYAYRNGYNCQSCTAVLRKFRGHEEEGQPINIMGYRMTKCPLMFVTDTERIYINLWADYKKGILPNRGGWLDQPMKFYSIMNIVDGVMSKIDEEEKG